MKVVYKGVLFDEFNFWMKDMEGVITASMTGYDTDMSKAECASTYICERCIKKFNFKVEEKKMSPVANSICYCNDCKNTEKIHSVSLDFVDVKSLSVLSNKIHILNLIISMWENDLIEDNGAEEFENWCQDNIHNEEQQALMNEVKEYVDKITFILAED